MSKYPVEYTILEKFDFERPPVGVKFSPVRPEGLKKPDKPMDFCEMLVEAQNGKAFYVTKDDFTCIGTMLLGMQEVEPGFESGLVGPRLGGRLGSGLLAVEHGPAPVDRSGRARGRRSSGGLLGRRARARLPRAARLLAGARAE